MKKLRRTFFLLLLAIALPLLISHWSIGGNSYIARNVGFRFSQAPKCIYSLDLVGHGKEFDLLKVYEISSDIASFEEHMQDRGWNPLPLSADMARHPICKADFDGNMRLMLSCTHGYWLWDGQAYRLMVYDAEKHLLYIRKSTLLYGT